MRIFQGNSAPNGLLVVSDAYKYFNGSLRKNSLWFLQEKSSELWFLTKSRDIHLS